MASLDDKLDKLFGTRSRYTKTPAVPKGQPKHAGETPAQRAMREAREADHRRFKSYLDARARRLEKLKSAHPGVSRYMAALDKLRGQTEVVNARSVDIDLAELVLRCRLDTIPRDYDRFLVGVEYTRAWISSLKRGVRLDDDDPLPFGGREPDTIDDIKLALRLV